MTELDRLTEAERDVVVLVCEGLTNRQIGERLCLSPRTVQGRLIKVFRKFGVSTRSELVARAVRGEIGGRPAASRQTDTR